MRFDCASRTHVGLIRKINEDSMFADPERGLWVVADGMGGHDAGELASAMVVDALRCLPVVRNIDETAAQAVDALRQVNRELIDLARSAGGDRKVTIGTTVVGLTIAGGSYRCFWMGDSRAYLIRDRKIVRLTHDHSLVQELVDAGMLGAEEAERHESANKITRAVGASEQVQVDMVGGDVRPNDQFLLASDGLTRLVGDDELADVIASRSPAQAGDELIETVLARGAPDNVSLIVAKLL